MAHRASNRASSRASNWASNRPSGRASSWATSWATLAFVLLLGPRVAGAQDLVDSEPEQPADSSLRVSLVTIGWGDAVWERFGHNALWIENPETGLQEAYNWGVFDFGQVDFMPRLARGTMLYRMEVFDPSASLEGYRMANRSVWVQDLALSPSQKTELMAFLRWNAQPENQYYRYDYYLDNCSTRIRDALDQALGGRINATSATDTTEHTFRWHTRRLLPGIPAAYLGIQFVLGPRADHPITRWEEMFLPLSLMDGLRNVEVLDENGVARPLVAEEWTLFQGTRPPEPESTPLTFPIFLAIGLLWAGALRWMVMGGSPWSWPRRLGVTALAGGWGLVAGTSGILLLAAWAYTDHTFWYENLNLLQMNPLFLPVPLAFLFFLIRGRFWKWTAHLAGALVGLSALGVVLFVLGRFGQENGEILALAVPLNVSLWLTSIRLCRGANPPEGTLKAEPEAGAG